MFQACKDNLVLPVCFFGVTIIRLVFILFNTFLLLWITSFVDTGVLESEAEAKTIIQYINVISVITLILLFRPIGSFADRYPAYITIPCSFLFRAFAVSMFLMLDDPRAWQSYAVVAVLIVGSLLENTCVDGLFNKNLPKDIRGSLNSAYSFFGNFGILLFTKAGGYMYDNVSPSSPFIVVACCDVVFAVLVIILRLMKKFNQ
jgi:hypothetical protein